MRCKRVLVEYCTVGLRNFVYLTPSSSVYSMYMSVRACLFEVYIVEVYRRAVEKIQTRMCLRRSCDPEIGALTLRPLCYCGQGVY